MASMWLVRGESGLLYEVRGNGVFPVFELVNQQLKATPSDWRCDYCKCSNVTNKYSCVHCGAGKPVNS